MISEIMFWLSAIAIIVIGFLITGKHFAGHDSLRRAVRDLRIALAYLAYRTPEKPEYFAKSVLEGNEHAIRRNYPDYAAYRARVIENEEDPVDD